MSKILQPFRFAGLLAASLIITTSALCADAGPSVRVTSAIEKGVVRLDAKANGPFEYKVLRPSTDICYIDLTGVSAGTGDSARVLGTQIVRSYRLEQYQAGTKPISRLEILLGAGATPNVTRQASNEILVSVSREDVQTSSVNPGQSAHVVETAMHVPEPMVSTTNHASIQQISVTRAGADAEVLVLGTGVRKYQELKLSNPDRLVLDFADAKMVAPRKTVSSFGPIKDVRAGQFSAQVARVVIDLSTSSPYSVKPVDGGIAVKFASGSAITGNIPRAKQAVTAKPNRSEETISEADSAIASSAAEPTGQQQTSTETSVTQSAQQTAGQTQNKPPAIPATPAGVNQAERTIPALVSPANVAPRTPAASSSADATPEMIGDSTGIPSHTIILSGQAAAASPNATKYTGAPISVNFKGLDVQDFFRLISEISGLNVVVDPNVKGSLTIVLNNVPWDQALDIVLMNFDLGKQLDGNVLRIATKDTLKKEADENKELAKAQTEAEPLVTTTRVLSYAKAADVSTTLKSFLSPRGTILSDPRTNTLIISDIPSVLPVMDNLIRELDKRSKQVEIEARVVAANRSFAQEIGSQFAFAGSATNGRNIFGGNPNVGTSVLSRNSPPLPVPPLISGSGTGTSSSLPLNTNLGATVATSGVSYAFSSANFALDYLITASESKGVGKLLSRPKLITQNNVQAMVEQGTKIPIQTVINNTISVQYIDAVLQLQVTPQITNEGTVFMNVHIENTQIDPAIPRVNGIPALDTQAQNTQVLVDDGQTVMIGGIIVSNQQNSISEVPYVGSLPIIGKLFQHRTVSTTSQELLFFITPRILP